MPEIYLLIIFILFSSYFSGVEIAVYCINRVRLQYKVKRGVRKAIILRKLLDNPQALICTILIGNNVLNYLASATFTGLLPKYLPNVNPELLATLILAPVMLVFAEVVPKDFCQRKADTFLYAVSPSVRFFSQLFYPLVFLLEYVNKIPQLFFKKLRRKTHIFTPYRLGFFIREGAEEGVISDYQDVMARNIMELRNIPVKKIMIPLKQVAQVPYDTNSDQIKILAKSIRFSRMPVYKGVKNNIIGFINLFDFLSSDKKDPVANDFLKKTELLDEETPIDDALMKMQKSKQRLAVVIGKNKKSVGIVTIKDLVEEIVGELLVW